MNALVRELAKELLVAHVRSQGLPISYGFDEYDQFEKFVADTAGGSVALATKLVELVSEKCQKCGAPDSAVLVFGLNGSERLCAQCREPLPA